MNGSLKSEGNGGRRLKNRSPLVFQSAAMEETVIWEQHTVTLHRVSVYSPLIHSPLPSPLLALSAYLRHLNPTLS